MHFFSSICHEHWEARVRRANCELKWVTVHLLSINGIDDVDTIADKIINSKDRRSTYKEKCSATTHVGTSNLSAIFSHQLVAVVTYHVTCYVPFRIIMCNRKKYVDSIVRDLHRVEDSGSRINPYSTGYYRGLRTVGTRNLFIATCITPANSFIAVAQWGPSTILFARPDTSTNLSNRSLLLLSTVSHLSLPVFEMVSWITLSFSLLIQVIFQRTVSGFTPLKGSFRFSRSLQVASNSADEPALRIGHGFDIHRLIEGTKLIIGSTLWTSFQWHRWKISEANMQYSIDFGLCRRSRCSLPCRSRCPQWRWCHVS